MLSGYALKVEAATAVGQFVMTVMAALALMRNAFTGALALQARSSEESVPDCVLRGLDRTRMNRVRPSPDQPSSSLA